MDPSTPPQVGNPPDEVSTLILSGTTSADGLRRTIQADPVDPFDDTVVDSTEDVQTAVMRATNPELINQVSFINATLTPLITSNAEEATREELITEDNTTYHFPIGYVATTLISNVNAITTANNTIFKINGNLYSIPNRVLINFIVENNKQNENEDDDGIVITWDEEPSNEIATTSPNNSPRSQEESTSDAETAPIETILEQLITKESLSVADMAPLLQALKHFNRPQFLWTDNYIKLGTFLRKLLSDRPIDLKILYANLDTLTPEILHSIVLVGGEPRTHIHPATNKEERISIYMGNKFNGGAAGDLYQVYVANYTTYKLEPLLFKQAKSVVEDDASQAAQEIAYKIDRHMSIKIMKTHAEFPDEAGWENILVPRYCFEDGTLLPIISNKEGKAVSLKNLLKLLKNPTNNPLLLVKKICQMLSKTASGLMLLTKHGMLNGDFKPDNIMDAEKIGGVIIDLGGIIDLELVKNGIIDVKDAGNNFLIPLYIDPNNPTDQERSAIVFHTVPTNNMQIISNELLGKLPPDITHKYAYAQMIETIFINLNLFNPMEAKIRNKLWGPQQLELEPFNIPQDQFNTLSIELQSLYLLYRKLYRCWQHPYLHLNNDPTQGVDNAFISMDEIKYRFEEITSFTQS